MRLISLIAVLSLSAWAAEPDVHPKDLPRFPALSPADATKSFVTREGFRMELAASEPNIASPVAISFDESGRMYVVEMRDYSEHRDEKLGRVRFLEDVDGDGHFEKSTIFAEGLAWPTAVICYDGGVFVGATPDIFFMRDTNGDGKADLRRVIFTGFGKDQPRLNVQQLFNSFMWGIDNRIHGATGGNGGTIDQVASGGPSVRLGSRDFSFDPRTLTIRAETGGGQHGLSFDDFGRKFICSNSSHIRMAVFEDRYIQGVSGIDLPPAAIDIAREGPAAEVFRISPEEPWRTIRTRWRVAGEVPGPIEGGGRASGYFTGATGVTIYRGDAFPPEFSNNAFVGDAGGNLVHRKILEQTGVVFEAHRPNDELNREFVASSDTWFRPVQFANAPDRCLYVIDMYREVIEHPWSLPPNLKRLIDLDSGRERGRIWRVVPQNFERRPLPNLAKASTAELVAMLDHANGWHRDTAARLLYQRQEANAAPLLAKLLTSSRPPTRTHALRALAGLNQLSRGHVAAALRDNDAGVLENALCCLELLKPQEQQALSSDLERLAGSTNARVCHQLAWTLSATQPENTAPLLAKIISTDASDPWIRAAVLVAARQRGSPLFRRLINDQTFLSKEGAAEFLSRLADKASKEMLEEALNRALTRPDMAAGFQLAAAAADAMNRRNMSSSEKLKSVFDKAAKALQEEKMPVTRTAAIRLLRLDDPKRTHAVFAKIFAQSNADAVRVEAFRGLLKNPRAATQLLWENWGALPTSVRQSAIDLILARNDGPAALIEALKQSRLTRADLAASQIQTLRQHSNPAISRPALELLGKVDSDRAAVIERFRPALEKHGDAKLGAKIFTERCATCHRLAGKGAAVGPDLESVRGNGREYLLTHLLDPNREVNARYVVYAAELRDGESVSGILARETDSAVTLRLANAEEKTIARAEIKKLSASTQSLMPVGLEEGLDVEAVAALLDFIGKNP